MIKVKQTGFWSPENHWILHCFIVVLRPFPVILKQQQCEALLYACLQFSENNLHSYVTFTHRAIMRQQNDAFEAMTSEKFVFSSLSFYCSILKNPSDV